MQTDSDYNQKRQNPGYERAKANTFIRYGGQNIRYGNRPKQNKRYGQAGQNNRYGRRERPLNSRNQNRPVDLREIAHNAMRKYNFEPSFSPDIMDFVNSIDGTAPLMAEKYLNTPTNVIHDMRHLLWSSIDNIDTEDLDQIEYCERAPNGEILVRVGVADVDVYVPKNNLLDMRARRNTTSVYTGIEIFPMLPDKLSKNLSSLPMGQDRLAMVVEFFVLPKGNVRPGKVYPALVRNKAKLVYEQVGAWLDGKGPMPTLIASTPNLEAQLRLQDEASLLLGKYRKEQGALELQTLEARALVKDNKVLGLVVVEEDRAKHIIENFMIGANGTMSLLLENANVPTIQRVVRIPKYWNEIVMVANEKGAKLPNMPNALALSRFLAEQKKLAPETFPDLSLTIVKLLGPGEYVMYDKKNPIGHFCLAVRSYTHGTAPNRRYVDLVIQRLLKATLKKLASPYRKDELTSIAEWCTEMEHASKKVERFMVKAEAATILAGRIGETFEAIITGSSPKGTYARLIDPPVEGKIISFVHGIHVGQKVKVRLVNLDPEEGYVDFMLMR